MLLFTELNDNLERIKPSILVEGRLFEKPSVAALNPIASS